MNRYILENVRVPLTAPREELVLHARRLSGAGAALSDIRILRESLDARNRPVRILTLAITVEDTLDLQKYEEPADPCIPLVRNAGEWKPVIVGAGPAGLGCALVLVRAGLKPVLVDMGPEVETRCKAVQDFLNDGPFRTQCSLVFGEGGAGTFSDGKLTTRRSDPLLRLFLGWLISHQAPEDILYRSKPHVGTDRLVHILPSIREELIRLGVTFHWNMAMEDLLFRNDRLYALRTSKGDIPCTHVFLATGTSSEDLLPVLERHGARITPRPFQAGVRMEQPAERIARAVYGRHSGLPGLWPAEYQFVLPPGTVRSFCMCPGGTVVCSSPRDGHMVVNGMSLRARNGPFSNAALICTLPPAETWREAIERRASIEQTAFAAGGGNWSAPGQTIASFLAGSSPQVTACSHARGVTPVDLRSILPSELANALAEGLPRLPKVLSGVTDGLLIAPETRVSPPWRVERETSGETLPHVFVIGEGSGYASGISTSAMDGMRTALSLLRKLA